MMPGMAVGQFVGFGGARLFTVVLANRSVSDLEFTPANALAGFRLGTDGKLYVAEQGGNSSYAEVVASPWLVPTDAAEANNYECFATFVSGVALSSGITGSWLDLAADQTWTRERTTDVEGVTTSVITVDIRLKGTGVNLASATITLNAEVA